MFVLTANDSKRKADTRLDGHWRAAQHSTSCHHTYPAVQLWQNSFFCVCSTWWGFNQNNSLTPSVLQWALWNTTQQPNAWTKTKTKGQIALFCSTLGWEVQSGSASTRQTHIQQKISVENKLIANTEEENQPVTTCVQVSGTLSSLGQKVFCELLPSQPKHVAQLPISSGTTQATYWW